jgi:hypothetical protein
MVVGRKFELKLREKLRELEAAKKGPEVVKGIAMIKHVLQLREKQFGKARPSLDDFDWQSDKWGNA